MAVACRPGSGRGAPRVAGAQQRGCVADAVAATLQRRVTHARAQRSVAFAYHRRAVLCASRAVDVRNAAHAWLARAADAVAAHHQRLHCRIADLKAGVARREQQRTRYVCRARKRAVSSVRVSSWLQQDGHLQQAFALRASGRGDDSMRSLVPKGHRRLGPTQLARTDTDNDHACFR